MRSPLTYSLMLGMVALMASLALVHAQDAGGDTKPSDPKANADADAKAERPTPPEEADFSEELAFLAPLRRGYMGTGSFQSYSVFSALQAEWQVGKNGISITRSFNYVDHPGPSRSAFITIGFDAERKKLSLARIRPGSLEIFYESSRSASESEKIGEAPDPVSTTSISFRSQNGMQGIDFSMESRRGLAYEVKWSEYEFEANEAKRDAGLSLTLVPSPGAQGPYGIKTFATKLQPAKEDYTLEAFVYLPSDGVVDAQGDPTRWPIVILSPGGRADTTRGYESMGQWLASWGFLTVLAAFDTEDGDSRAGRFSAALDWLEVQDADPESVLSKRCDLDNVAAAGHSIGGHAALMAGYSDERFKAVLALAPIGPEDVPETSKPLTCVIIGEADEFRDRAVKAYADAEGERYYVLIKEMNHVFRPQSGFYHMMLRMTSFLKASIGGDDRYLALLTSPSPEVSVDHTKSGKLEARKDQPEDQDENEE